MIDKREAWYALPAEVTSIIEWMKLRKHLFSLQIIRFLSLRMMSLVPKCVLVIQEVSKRNTFVTRINCSL